MRRGACRLHGLNKSCDQTDIEIMYNLHIPMPIQCGQMNDHITGADKCVEFFRKIEILARKRHALDGFFQSEEIEQVLPYETILSCNSDTYHGIILNFNTLTCLPIADPDRL